jgi:hypothetical protein
MKTLLALLAIAAVFGFVVTAFNFQVTVSLLFVAGFALIVIADYRRATRPLSLTAQALARTERLGLAA